MRRYIDRTVAAIALVFLGALLVFQSHALLSRRSVTAGMLRQAGELVDQANRNELPDSPRNQAAHSGKVFKAWEELPPPDLLLDPPTQSLNAWDFYPNQRLP